MHFRVNCFSRQIAKHSHRKNKPYYGEYTKIIIIFFKDTTSEMPVVKRPTECFEIPVEPTFAGRLCSYVLRYLTVLMINVKNRSNNPMYFNYCSLPQYTDTVVK